MFSIGKVVFAWVLSRQAQSLKLYSTYYKTNIKPIFDFILTHLKAQSH